MNDRKSLKSDDAVTDKVLVSFYLSPATAEKIDDVIFHIRKKLPINKRRKLTKTFFYEIGLMLALEDYDRKGEESLLWQTVQQILNS